MCLYRSKIVLPTGVEVKVKGSSEIGKIGEEEERRERLGRIFSGVWCELGSPFRESLGFRWRSVDDS